MLYWAVTFLIVAVGAMVLGFAGIAMAAIDVARILLLTFWTTFLATLVLGFTRR